LINSGLMHARQAAALVAVGFVLLMVARLWSLRGTSRTTTGPEPTIAGKALTAWLVERNYPDLRADEARSVVRRWGINCIPMLLDWLRLDERDYVQPRYQQSLNELLAKMKWTRLQIAPRPRPNHTWIAFQVLSELGPQGKAAVPGLIKVLGDRNKGLREFASRILADMAPDSVPALVETLSHGNERVKVMTAGTLERIGPRANDAMPALRTMRGQGPLALRYAAARALVGCADDSNETISVLLEAVRQGEVEIRDSAYHALGSLGSRAEAAVPA